MPNLSWLVRLMNETIPHAMKGEIPEAADRAAGVALRDVGKPGPEFRNNDISFGESPASHKALTAVPAAVKSTEIQKARRLAEAFGGLFEAQPGLPTDVQKHANTARWRGDAAGAVARETVKGRILDKLQGAMPERIAKAELLQRLAINTDDLATLQRKIKADPNGTYLAPGGRSLQEVTDTQNQLVKAASGRPDVVQAYTGYRNLVDELFDNYVAKGYISPDRQLAEYTPFVKITQINDANGRLGGSGAKRTETLLSQLKARGADEVPGLRHTGALRLLIDQLSDFHTKFAEDEMFLKILDDQTLNLSKKYPPGTILPEGYVRFRPEPGMPGYGIKDSTGNLVAGFINTLGSSAGDVYFHGFVLPERLVRFLKEFRPADPPEMQGKMYRSGSWLARQLTVYNAANTALNVQGDLMTALFGKAGEKAQPVGILKNYFKAADVAIKGILKGERGALMEKAINEGVSTGTFASTIDGLPVDAETARLLGEHVQGNLVTRGMKGYRQVVEATPRIAAGLEAESRGADFGEAARYATLEFGAGSPAHTRNPTFRFLFPFWQYMGLASKRVFDLVTTPGSRGRAMAALTIPPVATMLWNYRDEQYRKVEQSLPKWQKDTMHVIVPDVSQPGYPPLLDEKGSPVVVPMRWLVTEQVAQMFGLGNLPTRVRRVVEGRDTPGQLATETGVNLVKQIGQQAVPFNMASSLITGRDQLTGEEKPRAELAVRSLPLGRDIIETVKAGKNFGAGAAVKKAASRAAGVSFIAPIAKGKRDATLIDLVKTRNDARKKMRAAKRNGDDVEANRQKEVMLSIQKDIKRVSAARKKGK